MFLAEAYAFAGQLYARDKSLTLEQQGSDLYELVDALGFGSDERKADLYAQLEEKLTGDTKFSDAVVIIGDSMFNTHRRYPHG